MSTTVPTSHVGTCRNRSGHDVKAVLLYTASRIGLFAGVLAVLAFFGLSGYPLVLIAIVLSAPASYFLLSRQRAQMSVVVERTIGSLHRRAQQSAAAEDEAAANTAAPASPRRRITAIR